MAGTSDGVREMTLTLQFISSLQSFTDAWLDATCSMLRAYLSKDPVAEELAKSIEQGNGAVGYVPTEDAEEIIAKMRKEGVQCSQGCPFVTTEGKHMTAVAYHLDDAEKAQNIMSEYNAAVAQRINGMPDAFKATKGGLTTPLDMNRYSGSLVRQVEKTVDQETAMVMAQYAKRAGVPLYMDGPGYDNRYRVYFAERDQQKMDRICREVSKDMSGKSGEFLRREMQWENDLYMKTREHLFDDKKMKPKSAVVSQDGSMIIAGKIDSINGKPIYHNGEPQFSSMRYYTVIDKYGECSYIRRPPDDERSKSRLDSALANMENPIPLESESFVAYSKLSARKQWSYVMDTQRSEYDRPVCTPEEMEAIAEERSMSDDTEIEMDAEDNGLPGHVPSEKYRDDQSLYGFTSEEMETFENACENANPGADQRVDYCDEAVRKFSEMETGEATINFNQMVEITEADLAKERSESEIDERLTPDFTDSIDDQYYGTTELTDGFDAPDGDSLE